MEVLEWDIPVDFRIWFDVGTGAEQRLQDFGCQRSVTSPCTAAQVDAVLEPLQNIIKYALGTVV